MTATAEVAELFGLTESELFRQGLISFMREKKRQTLQLKLEILARYGALSLEDLESRIEKGQVVEHPGWEDLIVAENLTTRLGEIDGYLGHLQRVGNDRAQCVRGCDRQCPGSRVADWRSSQDSLLTNGPLRIQ